MIIDIVNDLITDYIEDIIEVEDSIMFTARVSALIPDVTGDGINYLIIFDDDVVNIGNHYNPVTGIFTAPFTGLYVFYTNVWLRAIQPTHAVGVSRIATTTQDIRFYQGNPANEKGAANDFAMNGAIQIKLIATDTVSIQTAIGVGGNPKVVDVSNIGETIFGGALIKTI